MVPRAHIVNKSEAARLAAISKDLHFFTLTNPFGEAEHGHTRPTQQGHTR